MRSFRVPSPRNRVILFVFHLAITLQLPVLCWYYELLANLMQAPQFLFVEDLTRT